MRLSQVLSNLLNNAAKYTDEGGAIALTARYAGDEVSITVRDTGIGIRADLLPHVFDLFMQADRSLARSLGGLGIGLTLVRQLVEMHGGRVAAKSEGPGKGSEFTIWLPIAREKAPDTVAASMERVHNDISHRILIVEDNADARESLGLLLEMEGHDVRRAQNGETALKVAQEFQPQVIFLDLGLPHMDGYEVIHRLRADVGAAQPIVIALTGYGQAEDRQRTEAAGFDYHLTKPVALEEVTTISCVGRDQPTGRIRIEGNSERFPSALGVRPLLLIPVDGRFTTPFPDGRFRKQLVNLRVEGSRRRNAAALSPARCNARCRGRRRPGRSARCRSASASARWWCASRSTPPAGRPRSPTPTRAARRRSRRPAARAPAVEHRRLAQPRRDATRGRVASSRQKRYSSSRQKRYSSSREQPTVITSSSAIVSPAPASAGNTFTRMPRGRNIGLEPV